jgi:hypothetical protein
MLKNKKRLWLLVALYVVSLILYRIGTTYRCLECQGNLKGIFNYVEAYRLDNKKENPISLKNIEQNSDIPQEAFLCPVSNERYIYFSYAKDANEILLSDSIPTHSVIRDGLIGYGDFLTYRLFAPKGRMVFYGNGVEGFVSEKKYKKHIQKQESFD